MPREDFKDLSISSVTAYISDNWTNEDDLKVKKDTTSFRMSNSRKGLKHSEESKKLISLSHIGIKNSPEVIAKIANKKRGTKHSDQTKEKMALAHKGTIFTEEWCKNISKGQKGKIVSKETRNKLSLINKGRKHTPEQTINQSKSQLGRKISPETIKRRLEKRIINGNIKPVIFHGVQFTTMKEASLKLKMPYTSFVALYKKLNLNKEVK